MESPMDGTRCAQALAPALHVCCTLHVNMNCKAVSQPPHHTFPDVVHPKFPPKAVVAKGHLLHSFQCQPHACKTQSCSSCRTNARNAWYQPFFDDHRKNTTPWADAGVGVVSHVTPFCRLGVCYAPWRRGQHSIPLPYKHARAHTCRCIPVS